MGQKRGGAAFHYFELFRSADHDLPLNANTRSDVKKNTKSDHVNATTVVPGIMYLSVRAKAGFLNVPS